ncbi:MAG: helix-turn-helix domain-containing protein [Sulfuricellaceae bacterium]
MKIRQQPATPEAVATQLRLLGELLSRLRLARRARQADTAARAGIARSTASRIEKGDPAVAIGQVLRYLDAIAPGKTLMQLLGEEDPAVSALAVTEKRHRARLLSETALKELDF